VKERLASRSDVQLALVRVVGVWAARLQYFVWMGAIGGFYDLGPKRRAAELK
jgi:hypothetical protein